MYKRQILDFAGGNAKKNVVFFIQSFEEKREILGVLDPVKTQIGERLREIAGCLLYTSRCV